MSRIKPTWVQIKAKLVGFLGTFEAKADIVIHAHYPISRNTILAYFVYVVWKAF